MGEGFSQLPPVIQKITAPGEALMMKRIIALLLIMTLVLTSILPLSAQEITASYIILSSDTGQTLLEKDSTGSADPTLLIRLMICYLAVQNFDLDQNLITENDFVPLPGVDNEYGFSSRKSYIVSVLLKLAILSCDPNAVYVMALALAESSEQLASMMNTEAKSMGLSDTQFIFTEDMDTSFSHTTLKDTAIFLSVALQDQIFKEYYCMQAALLDRGWCFEKK